MITRSTELENEWEWKQWIDVCKLNGLKVPPKPERYPVIVRASNEDKYPPKNYYEEDFYLFCGE